MSRAGTRRRPSGASQALSHPRATQRTQRNRTEETDEEDEEGDDGSMDVDDDEENAPRDDDLVRKSNQLVRLALFAENKRNPLRREEISKKVLGSSTRSFNQVFQLAQNTLRKTFGMELVELRSRAELGKDSVGGDEDLDEVRKTAGVKKKAAAAGSKSYILRSILDPAIIENAAQVNEKILEEEALEEDDNDDNDERRTRTYGSLISWSHTDQLGSLGILYIVLALILVSGRVLSDAELRAHLKKLRQPMSGSVKFDAHSTHKSVSMEAYMNMIIRQGYVERLSVGDAKKGKGKRVRATQRDDDSGATYEWRWGNRAHSEVGEKAIAQFVAEFMVGEQEAEDDEEEVGRSRGRQRQDHAQNKVDRMAAGIERAAGGNLSDLK
ncbi:MAGE-domain-containing protein [Guyanagaster necrorhizus]|uniref:MAGE-domain-containing protein n=1 Tax=Guyanagaster necrorhizus TaxID=856835 RepID=A0A9P7VLS9_9AGAR|nr:MAGE-domain-containing protein [Guyanagaster necrorhizus MCA 3950]KAG7442695.1 MAGE-domain-containing protein [Guyanagaster necrorhizus MCA 3950]